MGKYFLIGIPDCGKSTLGKLAADVLKFPYFDTDVMACDLLDFKSTADIFRAAFNQGFLNAQRAAINEIAKLDGNAIISTGAEVSLISECTRQMCALGTIIHIIRKHEIILEHIRKSRKSKLVLRDVTNGTEINMQENAIDLYMQEYPKYEAIADFSFDNNGSEDEGVQKLVILINQCQAINKEIHIVKIQ